MNRRQFLRNSTLASIAVSLPKFSFAQAKGSDKIKVGLIGCGNRGCGAICNMIEADPNIKIVAVADLFEDRFKSHLPRISNFCAQKKISSDVFNIDKVEKFFGWNAVDNILSTDADLIVDASPPVFRPGHFEKIINAGKHAFLEKPACVDVTQVRQMYKLAKLAQEKNLCVVCGTQRRHHSGYQEIIKRVQDGEIGEIVSADCYWHQGGYFGQGLWGEYTDEFCKDPEEIEYQIRNWPCFTWTSGDHIVEQHVHNIDVVLWAMGDAKLPDIVRSVGWRSTDLEYPKYGDRFSHFATDFDMGEGIHIHSYASQDPKSTKQIGEQVVGTKGYIYTNLYGTQTLMDPKGNLKWKAPDSREALVQEHADLLAAIRNGTYINTLNTLVNATLTAITGRMSAYSGKQFKFDWALSKSRESFMPKELKFGKKPISPIPIPGKNQLV